MNGAIYPPQPQIPKLIGMRIETDAVTYQINVARDLIETPGHLDLKKLESDWAELVTRRTADDFRLKFHILIERTRRALNKRDPGTVRPPYSDGEMLAKVEAALAAEEGS